jgi:hypothetical protein
MELLANNLQAVTSTKHSSVNTVRPTVDIRYLITTWTLIAVLSKISSPAAHPNL